MQSTDCMMPANFTCSLNTLYMTDHKFSPRNQVKLSLCCLTEVFIHDLSARLTAKHCNHAESRPWDVSLQWIVSTPVISLADWPPGLTMRHTCSETCCSNLGPVFMAIPPWRISTESFMIALCAFQLHQQIHWSQSSASLQTIRSSLKCFYRSTPLPVMRLPFFLERCLSFLIAKRTNTDEFEHPTSQPALALWLWSAQSLGISGQHTWSSRFRGTPENGVGASAVTAQAEAKEAMDLSAPVACRLSP